jgi:hypothetical protein
MSTCCTFKPCIELPYWDRRIRGLVLPSSMSRSARTFNFHMWCRKLYHAGSQHNAHLEQWGRSGLELRLPPALILYQGSCQSLIYSVTANLKIQMLAPASGSLQTGVCPCGKVQSCQDAKGLFSATPCPPWSWQSGVSRAFLYLRHSATLHLTSRRVSKQFR